MDNQLVIAGKDGKDVTTSLMVAEIFGKRHADVLRDISDLHCSEQFRETNFAFIQSINDLGHGRKRTDTAVQMTKDGFSFLVMGYTGKKAAEFKEKFIKAFNEREALLNSDEYILQRSSEILAKMVSKLQASQELLEKRIEHQTAVIEQQAPAVKYVEEVLQSDSSHTITTIAKELGMKSAIELNQLLKQWDVQYRVDKHWVLKAKYQGKDYTTTRTYAYTGSDGKTKTSIETVWTEAGRKFIHDLVRSRMQ